ADDRALAIANVRQNEQNSQNRNSVSFCQFCLKMFETGTRELRSPGTSNPPSVAAATYGVAGIKPAFGWLRRGRQQTSDIRMGEPRITRINRLSPRAIGSIAPTSTSVFVFIRVDSPATPKRA